MSGYVYIHDITHCTGENCPARERCYRHNAYREILDRGYWRDVSVASFESEGGCGYYVSDGYGYDREDKDNG